MVMDFPQWGQVIKPFFGKANKSDTGTSNVEAIFSNVSKLGFCSLVIIRLSEVAEIHIVSDKVFCVMPF